MTNNLQEFLAQATEKAAADLEAALLRLPIDKRNWSAMDKARSALDQVAECAILNGSTVDLLKHKTFPDFDMAGFSRARAQLTADWPTLQSLLRDNTSQVVEAIRAVDDADLGMEVSMPWGTMTLAQIAAYPYWNMTYHTGQINFIASMLGCLQ